MTCEYCGEEKNICDCPRLKSDFIVRQARSLFIIMIGKIWLMRKKTTNINKKEVYCIQMKVKLPSTPWRSSLRHCATNRKVAGLMMVLLEFFLST
jgi:hypothetical protein